MPQRTDVLHVVGARPNFPKAAPVIKALHEMGVSQLVVNTGQHYDQSLTDWIMRDLGMALPDINLGVGSGTHAWQTAQVMLAFEKVLDDNAPGMVLVYGDVNSTIGAALVAVKLGIPVGHVESGLRSFDWTMPEEINRVLTDRLSTLHFTTSPEAEENLLSEGIPRDGIFFVGNPMIDSLSQLLQSTLASIGPETVHGDQYCLVTLHRPSNVDDPQRVSRIVAALNEAATTCRLVFPIHPRGQAHLEKAGLSNSANLQTTAPMGYTEFVTAMRGAVAVITDSGGVQEEATYLRVPCITLRSNTERPITITHGGNQLAEPESVPRILKQIIAEPELAYQSREVPLWDGAAGPRIARVIHRWLARRLSDPPPQ